MKQKDQSFGLYIHIPYCQKQCHYCDFLTFINRDETIDKYIQYLLKEIKLYRHLDLTVDTIYFGGGTPSYIDSQYIQHILNEINLTFHIQDDCEISIEMNPESVSEEKLQDYLEAGMNRFTMGVQSFDDQVLRMMGRIHRRDTVFEKLQMMDEMEIHNKGIDLMFGNPKQNRAVLLNDIQTALTMNINHLSYYALMIKERTAFHRWVETGQFILLDDETERSMYHLIQDELSAAGFEQYEISNFAKPGYQSRHNLKYWKLQNFLGLGIGAAGNFDLVRTQNVGELEQYYHLIDQDKLPISEKEAMDIEEREKEYIMLHMRLVNGFSLSEFQARFGSDFLNKYESVIQKHLKYKTIEVVDGNLRFTPYGLDVGNQFYLDIL